MVKLRNSLQNTLQTICQFCHTEREKAVHALLFGANTQITHPNAFYQSIHTNRTRHPPSEEEGKQRSGEIKTLVAIVIPVVHLASTDACVPLQRVSDVCGLCDTNRKMSVCLRGSKSMQPLLAFSVCNNCVVAKFSARSKLSCHVGSPSC